MRVLSMDEVGMEVIVDVFNRGFRDYVIPVTMDDLVLKDYIHVNDVSLKDSFIALDGEGVAQSFTFTGIRESRGWVGGLAVDPGHRGLGFGKAVLEAQLDRAKGIGLDEMWLECLDDNEAGLRMYGNVGFKKVGKVWFVQNDSPRAIEVRCPPFERRSCGIDDILPNYDKGHVWPKEARSLAKIAAAHVEIAVRDGKVEGHIIAFPSRRSSYIWDMTPNRFGESLLSALLREHETSQVSMANLHDKALLSILQRWGFVITHTLHVMRLKLKKGIW